MWNLTVKYKNLMDMTDFLNKISKVKNVEYHIEKGVSSDCFVSGENEFSKELVLEFLAEQIVTKYKTEYFNRNIKVDFLKQAQRNALIKALVYFDIESDIYYVLLAIENLQKVILRSVDIFILPKIKNKWAEFVTVTNLNGGHLLNYEVFVEFLKFLICSIQPKTKVVNLKCDINNYLFFDEAGSLIESNVGLSDELGLITNLVLLAPKNINIHCIDQVSNKTFKTLYYLFDKKINLLV